MMKGLLRTFFIGLLGINLLSPCQAARNLEKGTLIRDAEIESILKKVLHPLFKVAGLNPQAAKLYIIIDPDINAAAGLGYRIFIHSGLLVQAGSVAQVAGVLAHETGHIASGHLMRRIDAMERASLIRMAGYALGAATAIISGNTGALMAGILGGNHSALGSVLKYSRGQESAADQAGVRYMQQLGWPIGGFLEMMEKLLSQELLSSSQQEPYMRTHPLNQERVSFLKHVLYQNAGQSLQMPAELEESFLLAKTKLQAYTLPPGQVLLQFSEKRQDNLALYARAIAFYRDRKIPESLALFKRLSDSFANSPYVWEMLGQIFFEEGRLGEARTAYEKAYQGAPHEALIKMAYGQVLVASKHGPDIVQAVKLLEGVVAEEEDYPFAWHLLAVAYGKNHQPAFAAYALAKEAVCLEKFDIALQQITRALKGNLPPDLQQKLKDLRDFVKDIKDDKKKDLFPGSPAV